MFTGFIKFPSKHLLLFVELLSWIFAPLSFASFILISAFLEAFSFLIMELSFPITKLSFLILVFVPEALVFPLELFLVVIFLVFVELLVQFPVQPHLLEASHGVVVRFTLPRVLTE